MKTIIVLVLLLLIYFINNIIKSRFGAGLGGTAPTIDGKYKVEINFNYKNPASFGTNSNFKCIILYLERVGDLGVNISENIITSQPSKTDIFSNKNIFYTDYYSYFDNSITSQKIYYKIFGDQGNGSVNIQGTEYTRLQLINLLNTGNYSNLLDYLDNSFIDPYYIPLYRNPTNQQFSVDGYDKAKLITEVDANNNTILGANSKISATNDKVYFKTVSSTQFFKLYLSPGQYKFGVAIVNNRSTIQTDDYNVFPYTISDFRFIDTLLQVNGLDASSISASVTGLSAVIEYVKDTTPPVISNTSITDITYTTSKFNFTSNETGKVFTLAKISSEPVPSFDDILISGASNNISIGTNIILLSGLIPGNNYTLYSILQDTNTNYSISNNNKIFKNDFITPITSNSALTALNDKLLKDIVVSPIYDFYTDFRNIDNTVISFVIKPTNMFINYNNKEVILSGNNGRYNVYKDIVKYLNDINNYSQTGLYMPILNNPPLPTLNNTEKKSALDKLNLDLKTLLIGNTVREVGIVFPETTYNKEIYIVSNDSPYVVYNGVFRFESLDIVNNQVILTLPNLYKYIIDQINNTNDASIGSDLYINYLI